MSITFSSPNTTSSLSLLTYSILTFADFFCAEERDAEFCMLKLARKLQLHHLYSAVLLSKCFNISKHTLPVWSFLGAVTPYLKDSLLYYSSCWLLSDEYMSRSIKHIKVEITTNFLLLLVIINLKQLKGKIQIQ